MSLTTRTPFSGVVPPIPESRLDPTAVDDAVLMWVRHGRLTVRAEGALLVAEAGQAVWVAPGVEHSATLDAGSVALPMFFEAGARQLAGSCVVTVPPGWEDWLTYRTARSFGFTTGALPDRMRLLDLLAGAGSDRAVDLPRLPPMPRSPGARLVVQRLLRDPASRASPAELAASAVTSVRTLQRQLKDETGQTLGQWRTTVRVHAAAAHLARGRDLAWTAHQVGYASVSGFAHAFADLMGVSPGRYAALRSASDDQEPLLTALALGGPRPEPPAVPAVAPVGWIMPFDGVVWVYRGSVVLEISGRRWHLEAGDVVWLRRGITHRMTIAEGSIVLPLGSKPANRPVRAGAPTVVRMPVEAELFLLHTVVANHFLLTPPGHDDQEFLDLLDAAPGRPAALPEEVETIVSAVVRDPADRRTLADWADTLGIEDARLRRDFASSLGEPFPRWRANVRMNEARMLMWDGHPPSVVARRLGYRHLPAFTKAFAAAHGMPPREWLRRDAG